MIRLVLQVAVLAVFSGLSGCGEPGTPPQAKDPAALRREAEKGKEVRAFERGQDPARAK